MHRPWEEFGEKPEDNTGGDNLEGEIIPQLHEVSEMKKECLLKLSTEIIYV